MYERMRSMRERETAIGIDIGGTKVLGGLVEADGRIFERIEIPTRADRLLGDVVDLARSVASKASERGVGPNGVGVAAKGFVDSGSGRLVRSMSLGISDVPIVEAIQEALALPVCIANDVHACASGEIRYGLGREHDNLIVFNGGTGISAGFVSGGRLHQGAGGMAGEIGHMVVDGRETRRCACGRTGCLEDLVTRSRAGEPISVAEDARFGSLPPEYKLLAIGLANLVNGFNPSAVALVGGMFLKNPAVIGEFADAVQAMCLASAASSLQAIQPAAGGYDAVLLGAGTLALGQGEAA